MGTPSTVPVADIRRLWDQNLPVRVIAKKLGCSTRTIARLKLPERPWAATRGHLKPVKPAPVQHVSAVRMPEAPLQARADWPELLAAVERAKGCKAPQERLGRIAARYRLAVAVVQGLAARVWR